MDDELCFQRNGALINEFERLFTPLFSEANVYVYLIRMIAHYPNGIGQSQLIKESKLSDGGRIKQRLTELEEAGFILGFIPHGHQEKGIYYKVIDEFTLFYLRWMEPNLKSILKQDTKEAIGFQKPSYRNGVLGQDLPLKQFATSIWHKYAKHLE